MADPGIIAGAAGTGAAAGSVIGPWGTVIGAGVGAIGGLIAYLVKNGQENSAEAIAQRALDEYGSLQPEALEKAGAEVLGPSAMEGIKLDPAYKQAQMDALDSFKEIDEAGGLALEDKAALNSLMNRSNRQAASKQAAMIDQMQQRGALNSGISSALQQDAAQEAASRNNQNSLDVAGQAQRNRQSALLNRGNMAGQIRGQDFGEQSAIARAKDEIGRYNAGATERAFNRNQDNEKWLYAQKEAKAQNILQGKLGQGKERKAKGAADAQAIYGVAQGVGEGVNAYGQYAGQKANAEEDRKLQRELALAALDKQYNSGY